MMRGPIYKKLFAEFGNDFVDERPSLRKLEDDFLLVVSAPLFPIDSGALLLELKIRICTHPALERASKSIDIGAWVVLKDALQHLLLFGV